jgi:carbon-monoxide dehydrogenase medium subunit
MKASAFAYAHATSAANAMGLLAVHGEKARVLSRRQSPIPAMKMPLVAPQAIVLGGPTPHTDLLRSSDIVKYAPPLGAAVAHVAYPATQPTIPTASGRI